MQPWLRVFGLVLAFQAASSASSEQAEEVVVSESVTSRLYADDRLAVVVYAPSTYSKQLKCEALVESIRSQGQWGGRLYLITEQLKCYQHERWMQCGLDADIIAVDDTQAAGSVLQQGHSHSLWWRIMFGPTWEAFKARLMRSRLWQLVQPPAPVQALVYIHGCEVLVGAPLEPFMQDVMQRYSQPNPPMLVVAPPGMDARQEQQIRQEEQAAAAEREISLRTFGSKHATAPKHKAAKTAPDSLDGSGSIWVLHKQASAPLMEAWRQEVMLGSGASVDEDELLFNAVRRAAGADCTDSKAACMERFVAHIAGWSRKLWCDPLEGCGGTLNPAVFNSVPQSVCASTDHEMVSDWVTTLDLCVYQDLGYCIPTLMHAFAQSWLPYPQCGKLELGLSRLACQWSCTEPTVMRSPGFRTSVTPRPLTLV